MKFYSRNEGITTEMDFSDGFQYSEMIKRVMLRLMDTLIYKGIAHIERRHWWYRGRREIILRLLDRIGFAGFAKTPRTILSVGCGSGEEIRFLGRFGKVYGIDPGEDAIRFCRAAGIGEQVMQASAAQIPFPDESFDAVFVLDVLEHVRDEARALAQIHRVLKPGGIVVISVPAYSWLWSGADVRSHHFRRYTRRELEKKCLAQRFEVLRATYCNTILFLPLAAIKFLTRMWEPGCCVGAEVQMPPAAINSILSWLFLREAPLIARMNFPFGLSVLAVLRK